jgi:hypothetical protein
MYITNLKCFFFVRDLREDDTLGSANIMENDFDTFIREHLLLNSLA